MYTTYYKDTIYVFSLTGINEFISKNNNLRSYFTKEKMRNDPPEILMEETGIKKINFFYYIHDYVVPDGFEIVENITEYSLITNKLPESVHTIYIEYRSRTLPPIPSHIKYLIFNGIPTSSYCDYHQFNGKLLFCTNSQIEKIIFGSHFNQSVDNLPNSIKVINFGTLFNTHINKLPESLEELSFNDQQLINNLHFNFNFNKELNRLIQCKNLKILKLHKKYNSPLTYLPNSLVELYLGPYFNEELRLPINLKKFYFPSENYKKQIIFPNSITNITLGTIKYSNPLMFINTNLISLKIVCTTTTDLTNLPESLEELIIKNITVLNEICLSQLTKLKILKIYGKSIKPILDTLPNTIENFICDLYEDVIYDHNKLILPTNLKTVCLTINKNIDNLIFPSNTETIKFKIDETLNSNIYLLKLTDLPASLKMLDLSNCSNILTFFEKLPNNLEILMLDNSYNEEIKYYPSSLIEIYYGNNYNHHIKGLRQCINLKKIGFGHYFDKTIKYLPDSVEEISFGTYFKQKISTIPQNLKSVTFAKYHKNSDDFQVKFPSITFN